MAFTGWMVRLKSYGEIAANRLTQSGTVAVAQVGAGGRRRRRGRPAVRDRGREPGRLQQALPGGLAGEPRLLPDGHHAPGSEPLPSATAASRSTRRRRCALNVVGLELPLLWMVAVYGTGAGGQFALAQRIVALPVGVVAGAVGQVYFAEAARLVHDGVPGLRALFLKTTRSLALTAIGPFALGAVVSPFLFGIIFGQAWTEAGLYVAILAPMYFLQFVTWPTGGHARRPGASGPPPGPRDRAAASSSAAP